MDPVTYYLDLASRGDTDSAFHGLRELPTEFLARLQAEFRAETDPSVRALVVRVIWEHRNPSVIGFLGDALRDTDQTVWMEALDGLVALACAESLRTLQFALDHDNDQSRRAWIDEAIVQTIEILTNQARGASADAAPDESL